MVNTSHYPPDVITTLAFLPTTDQLVVMSAFERSLILTNQQLQSAVHVLTYIYVISVVIAVPLTLCNVIVFVQPSMRSGTSNYVIGISVAQLFLISCNVGYKIVSQTAEIDSLLFCVYTLYFAIYGFIVARRGVYLVMCLLSLERLYAVVRPLHAKTFFLSKHSALCTCGAFFFTACWHGYIVARTVVRQSGRTTSGKKLYIMTWTDLYKNNKSVNDGFSLAAKIVLSYCTLFVQIVLNACTIWALRRHNVATKRVQSSADDNGIRRQRERQMTVTILAATISYAILSLPAVFHNLLFTVFTDEYAMFKKYGNLYHLMGKFSLNLTLLSAGIDFVCFVSISSTYRRTLLGLFHETRDNKGK